MSRASRAAGRSRRRSAADLVRGIAAMAALIALVAGLPLLLYRLGGSPVPRHLPTWPQFGRTLTRRDNGTLFLRAVRDISWLAWAAFTVAVLAELQAAVRGRIAPRLRLGGLQSAAGNLVAFALLTFSGSASVLAVPLSASAAVALSRPAPGAVPDGQGGTAAAARPATVAAGQHLAIPAAQVRSMGHFQLVTVRAGDCLWTLAQRFLGDGDRYTEIARLNLGHDMGGGVRFHDPAVIVPGWVLQVPAHGDSLAAPSGDGAHPGGSSHPHHAGEPGQHHPHPSREPAFRKPHPSAAPAVPGSSSPGAPAGAPAQPASRGAGSSAPGGQAAAAAAPAQAATAATEVAVFAAGMVAGGAAVALSRMRHRQRQARRPGRRIPLPASAPVMEAERRLRADSPPVPAASLRGALGALAAGLADGQRPVPAIGAVRVRPELLEVLLAAHSAGPPSPFVAGSDQLTWDLPLPLAAGREPVPAATGDLLPGLVTLGVSDDGYLLIDLEYLGVTAVSGPAALADQLLATAAAELATSGLAGWYDLILVGFSELEAVGGRVTCCDDFDSGLDLVAAKAVALRRRLGGSGPQQVRARRLLEPGDEDWALTLLVSRIAPSMSEMALLRDLAADPGGIAALIPEPAGEPDTQVARIELDTDPAQAAGMVATVSPLGLVAFPQPLGEADYAALASLFGTASRDDDVAPEDPPYDRIGWASRRRDDARPADQYDDFWRDSQDADDGWIDGVRSGDDAWPGEPGDDGPWPGEPGPGDWEHDQDPAAWPGEPEPDGHPAGRSSAANGSAGEHGLNGTPPLRWLPDQGNGERSRVSGFSRDHDAQPGWPADQDQQRPAARLPAGWPAAGQAPEAEPAEDPGAVLPPGDGPSWRPVSQPASPEAAAAGLPDRNGTGLARHARPEDSRLSLRVGVLGTFTVNGEPGALLPAQSQLLLALAVNGRDGLSNRQLCELLGADPDHPKPSDSLRQLIVRTRRQLGRAADGREWIEHLGAGQYALHPQARVDWYEFDTLAREGLRLRDPALLTEALALLRGEPFTGCYYWWLDAALVESVRAEIVDAAQLLSGLELAGGDPASAARAARTGLAADPAAEQLWRALMRAEHAAGNMSGVREAWSRCLDVIAEIAADGEPHPETTSLYRQLVAAAARPAARSPG